MTRWLKAFILVAFFLSPLWLPVVDRLLTVTQSVTTALDSLNVGR